jgi:hypothetical protein
MAGGVFEAMNKVRSGAYIVFQSASQPLNMVGDRGIATLPIQMNWGANDTLIELTSEQLLDGSCESIIGCNIMEEESLIYQQVLTDCVKVLLFRMDTGGVKATLTLNTLTATAKYAGTAGNKIAVSIVENGSNFDVITSFNGAVVDTQTGTLVGDIVDNDFVDFSGTSTAALVANAGGELENGENGTVVNSTYSKYFDLLKTAKWNTLGIPLETSTEIQAQLKTFIKYMRDTVGTKVQAVANNIDADTEGIISTLNQGYKSDQYNITIAMFVARVTGMTAGCAINKSLTYYAFEDANEIIGQLSHEEIVSALQSGKFVLSARQDGVVVVEQDINTLHTFTSQKDYSFSKNRVIRTIDQINNDIRLLFEKSYLGKQDNNDDGRTVFKADIIDYCYKLQKMNAIQNFDGSTDITIAQGANLDEVIVKLNIQPVDSMEKLYMTVTLRRY